jgi:undecaprenyl-diphosphatase
VILSTVTNQLTYAQAIIMGVLQGITELFPVSSLGHSVILPKLFGWNGIVNAQSSASTSNFLTFLVGLHVGTALALIVFYLKDWGRILGGLWSSAKARKISTSTEHLAWLIAVGSIPVGLAGILLEKHLRTIFAKPTWASAFLILNGFVLFAGERLRRKTTARHARPTGRRGVSLKSLSMRDGFIVGASQILALLAGFSRSGVSIVTGLSRGLSHDDAAKFSFLLATPIILAAGLYKLPSLATSGKGIMGQVLVGSIAAGIAAYLSVRFLTRWFSTKTLAPFAYYCMGAGVVFMALTA